MNREKIMAEKLKNDIDIEEINHSDYEYLTIWNDQDFEKCDYKLLRKECHKLGVQLWKAIDFIKMRKSENEKKNLLKDWNEHKIFVYYPLYHIEESGNHFDTREYVIYEEYSN